MTAFLTIEFSGNSEQVQAMLGAMEIALNPANVGEWLATSFAPYLKARASARFTGEGDDVVGTWPELAAATITERQSLGYGAGPIQIRTGDLEAYIVDNTPDISITQISTKMVYPNPRDASENSILAYKVGSAQKGNKRTGAPARPVLGINHIDLEYFITTFGMHLKTSVMSRI